jgi:hypothetical protein
LDVRDVVDCRVSLPCDDIKEAASCGVTVYSPVPKSKQSMRERYAPLPSDSEALATWRMPMGTEEAKAIYKERAATAECVNAAARNHGLHHFLVRGRDKAEAIAGLFALAHNLPRLVALKAAGIL